jgi:hypothetical protein
MYRATGDRAARLAAENRLRALFDQLRRHHLSTEPPPALFREGELAGLCFTAIDLPGLLWSHAPVPIGEAEVAAGQSRP